MKVWGIGMPRTGTTSLTAALEILGFTPALHNPNDIAEIARCGSATDITIACRFRSLAFAWPDSRFIYTARDEATWLASIDRHYSRNYLRIDATMDPTSDTYGLNWFRAEAVALVFGRNRPRGDVFLRGKRRHERDVRRFFHSFPDRLLTIDITRDAPDSEKWGPICAFLNVPVPGVTFPHLNRYVEADRAPRS